MAVAGTRPNYVKLAPLVRAARDAGREILWIDAGQHTDEAMRARIIEDAGLSPASVRIEAPPSGPDRTAKLAAMLEAPLRAMVPSVVLVLGDVDATVAAAQAAWALDLPMAHVEAGLRCGDLTMPEERNRILVDALSDRYYTTEPSAHGHLSVEGLEPDACALEVGNVMADALLALAPRLATSGRIPGEAAPPAPILVTLHRQVNVDDPDRLAAYIEALSVIAAERPVHWPVHPRTAARLGSLEGLARRGIVAEAPLGYLSFLQRLHDAAAVITDSGGVQVEAALLGIPCVVARDVTEHALSLTHGGAVLAGRDPAALPAALSEALVARAGTPEMPAGWDGRAAQRIVADLAAGFDRPERRRSPREA